MKVLATAMLWWTEAMMRKIQGLVLQNNTKSNNHLAIRLLTGQDTKPVVNLLERQEGGGHKESPAADCREHTELDVHNFEQDIKKVSFFNTPGIVHI